MLSVEEYLDKVVNLARLLPSEQCPISSGFGRTLATKLIARYPVPPFSNSAMDGFAVSAADLTASAVGLTVSTGRETAPSAPDNTVRLHVVGDIPAGCTEPVGICPGQAARIMTGAPMPKGADTVVPVELTDQPWGDVPLPEYVEVQHLPAGANVRLAGEAIQTGETLMDSGIRWTAAAAAAAASVGYSTVELVRRPKVAVLATGSELVAPGDKLRIGQIPDSNSALVCGLAQQFGAEVTISHRVPDSIADFKRVLEDAASADIIVTTGAVSVGAHEVVRQVLGESLDFVKVAMQPGKPQASGFLRGYGHGSEHKPVGAMGDTDPVVLALPGNPVSVFVSAWAFLRPLIDAFQGLESTWSSFTSIALSAWKTPPGRQQFMPVVISADGVTPAHRLGSGSHLISSLHQADGLAVIPSEVQSVDFGDAVEVFPLRQWTGC